MTRCIGVLGGSGGVGATVLAALLAAASAPSVLVDLDVTGGGIAVTLGIEDDTGVRWSGLHAAGGRIDPLDLGSGLPLWSDVRVLSCDRPELPEPVVAPVLDAALELGPTVIDLGRTPTPARALALRRCDVVVVVARASVAGVAGAVVTVDGLAPSVQWRLAVVRGPLRPARVARAVGVAAHVLVPVDSSVRDSAGRGLDPSLLRRGTRAAVRRLLSERTAVAA